MRPWVYLLAFSSLVGNAAFSRTESLPNIVLIFGDDLGRYASAYRDSKRPGLRDIITTPNMDRLAREGTLFQNAFVNVPS
jgi:arylsulfatase A-like enzyme